MNGFRSDYANVTSGVPQGSVLGPILFTLFVNDIDTCFKNSKFMLFADDLKVFRRIECQSDCLALEEDLSRLSNYCLRNRLALNLGKCFFISFTKKRTNFKHEYEIGGSKLETVSKMRDLGVIFDSRLHFDDHINEIVTRGNAALGFVVRMSREFRDHRTLLTLYTTLVRPKLEYCSSIWNPLYKKYIHQVDTIQNKFRRFFRRKFPGESLEGSLTDLAARRQIADALFLYKICNSVVDSSELLALIGFKTPTRTRLQQPFYLGIPSTNAGAREPLYRMTKEYCTRFSDVDIFGDTSVKFKTKLLECLRSAPT
jgi:hypothetical protein